MQVGVGICMTVLDLIQQQDFSLSNSLAPCDRITCVFPISFVGKCLNFQLWTFMLVALSCSSATSLLLDELNIVKPRSYLQMLKTDILTDGWPVVVLFAVTQRVSLSAAGLRITLFMIPRHIFFNHYAKKQTNKEKTGNRIRTLTLSSVLKCNYFISHYILQLDIYLYVDLA